MGLVDANNPGDQSFTCSVCRKVNRVAHPPSVASHSHAAVAKHRARPPRDMPA